MAAAAALGATLGTGGNEARASRGNVTHERSGAAGRDRASRRGATRRVDAGATRRLGTASRTDREEEDAASRARDDPCVDTERGAI